MIDSSHEKIEEQLVLVELSGIIESDFLTKTSGKCRILGLETERPLFELDGMVFQGEYDGIMGTSLLFEEKKHGEDTPKVQSLTLPDTNAATDKFVEHKYIVNKKLSMQRVFLTEKNKAKKTGEDLDNSQSNQEESRDKTENAASDNVNKPSEEKTKRMKLETSRR